MRIGAIREEDDGTKSVVLNWSTVLSSTVLAGLVTALSSWLVHMTVDVPNNRAANELKAQQFQLDLMQRAFQVEDPQQRVETLRFMVNSGLLHAKLESVDDLAKKGAAIPHWLREASTPPKREEPAPKNKNGSSSDKEKSGKDGSSGG